MRRDEFDEQIMAIQAVEIGTARALGLAFGAKPKPLPRWEDVRDGERKAGEEPAWLRKYRMANRID